jgi:hypothetical protein
MTLERGFRRIVIVLSIVVLGLGAGLDALSTLPHATVKVTLKDGREFTVERHTVKEYLTDREDLVRALEHGEGVYKGRHTASRPSAGDRAQDKKLTSEEYEAARRAGYSDSEIRRYGYEPPAEYTGHIETSAIASIKMTNEPSYWWWTDSAWAKVTAVLVALLWIVFYTVRWIVRGFAAQ